MPEIFVPKVQMVSPFTVSEYISSNLRHLDELRFAAMRDVGTVEELADRNGTKHLTAADGSKKQWNHWGVRKCLTPEVPHENLSQSNR